MSYLLSIINESYLFAFAKHGAGGSTTMVPALFAGDRVHIAKHIVPEGGWVSRAYIHGSSMLKAEGELYAVMIRKSQMSQKRIR